MRKYLLYLFACASLFAVNSTEAYAQDSRIYDLMYLPDAKTLYGETRFELGSSESSYGNGSTGMIDSESRVFTQELGYSLRENFSAIISMNHITNIKTTQPDNAAESEINNTGLGDPTLRFKWRALRQNSDDMIVDIIPYFTFKSGDATEGTTTQNGNSKKGHGYGLEVNAGRVLEKSQFAGFFRINYEGAYESKVRDGTSWTRDPKTKYEIGGIYQRTLAKAFFMNFSLSHTRWSDFRDDDNTNNTFVRTEARSGWTAGAEGVISPSENLALALGYHFSNLQDYEETYNTGTNIKYKNNFGSVLSMWARYQF